MSVSQLLCIQTYVTDKVRGLKTTIRQGKSRSICTEFTTQHHGYVDFRFSHHWCVNLKSSVSPGTESNISEEQKLHHVNFIIMYASEFCSEIFT